MDRWERKLEVGRLVTFEVPGQPQGKQRARATKGGFHFTPKRTQDYEKLILLSFENTVETAGYRFVPFDRPVAMQILAIRQIPKSWSAKKRAVYKDCFCQSTPDWDNIGKVVCDALNKVAFHDDKQVVDAQIKKIWGDEPKLIIIMWEMVR